MQALEKGIGAGVTAEALGEVIDERANLHRQVLAVRVHGEDTHVSDKEQQPWRERAEAYLSNPKQVHWIVEMGTERARTVARQTMKDVRSAMGLNY